MIADFEHSFRANNLEAVKGTPALPPNRVRKAIISGVFEGSGRKYSCDREVEEATNVMLNRIGDTYQRTAGGVLGWDCIILTGGGRSLLYRRLIPILKRENIIWQTMKARIPAISPHRITLCSFSMDSPSVYWVRPFYEF